MRYAFPSFFTVPPPTLLFVVRIDVRRHVPADSTRTRSFLFDPVDVTVVRVEPYPRLFAVNQFVVIDGWC